MKANRKILDAKDDDAVSPVIAVILMVAITVVLAATVYVWVSGFGAENSDPQKSIALKSAGPIDEDSTAGTWTKSYTVATASPGMKFEDMELHLSGTKLAYDDADCSPEASEWAACAGSTTRASTAVITAGDKITLTSGSDLSGAELNVIDPNSNSIMVTLTIS